MIGNKKQTVPRYVKTVPINFPFYMKKIFLVHRK